MEDNYESFEDDMDDLVNHLPACIQLRVWVSFQTPLCIRALKSQMESMNPTINVATMKNVFGKRDTEIYTPYRIEFPNWQKTGPGMWKCPVPQKDFMELFSAASNLPVAAYPEPGMFGVDGSGYEIRISDGGFVHAHYHWWMAPPKGWEGLGNLVDRMMGMIGV